MTHLTTQRNVFDFLIVLSAWLPFFIRADGLAALKLLRLLRLFRILRLVKFLPQLQVVRPCSYHSPSPHSPDSRSRLCTWFSDSRSRLCTSP